MMRDFANWALETAKLRGATYADARVMDIRLRDLSTKNGQVGTLAELRKRPALADYGHGTWRGDGAVSQYQSGRGVREIINPDRVPVAQASASGI